ncbi:MAG: glucose-6-phosphate isomerase family protein, partial [Methanoregula sp.]|nr:glucose-6-phosphate isomerase family protein [Methanoregula sp.]
MDDLLNRRFTGVGNIFLVRKTHDQDFGIPDNLTRFIQPAVPIPPNDRRYENRPLFSFCPVRQNPLFHVPRSIPDQNRSHLDAVPCHPLRHHRHPPANLDGEYVKTKGHYHPENPAGIGYPGLYEVQDGVAHFLLQAKSLDDIVLL